MDTTLYKKIISNIAPNARTEKYISKHYPEIYGYLVKSYKNIDFKESLYLMMNDMMEKPICYCGRPVAFRNSIFGYNRCCSKKCSNKDAKRLENIQSTKFEKYGDKSFNNKEKIKQTTQEKYGVENIFQSEAIKDKIKKTNIERYGVEYPSQSKSIQNKQIQNNLKKYGVERVQSLDEVKDKIKKTNQSNYISNHKQILSYDNDGNWVCRCPHKECNHCEEKTYVIKTDQYFARREFNIEPCTKLLPISKCKNNNTWIELFVKNILDKYNISYITNARNIIYPLELDIVVPEKNIAFECNGCFWHSDAKKDSKYHLNKFKNCLDNDMQLISIWEDQIINTPDIVESVILSKFGIYNERIYARKCTIKEIDAKSCSSFLNNNHLQGKTKTKVRLGIFYNNDLYGVMTFNTRSKLSGGENDACWELNRFCTKVGIQIVGGAERLLDYFVKRYSPHKIVSFSSNDISTGKLYEKLGFKNSGITQSYWYIHKKTYIRYHRTSFQKSQIKQYAISENETEKDIMSRLPYYRIYDSGHIKWEKIYNE